MDKIIVETQLLWKYAQNRETGNWVAVCEELHMAVEGDSFRDLVETINESNDHLFLDLLSTGRLENFLSAHGWTLMSEIPSRRVRNPRFDIPFDTRRVPERDLEEAFA